MTWLLIAMVALSTAGPQQPIDATPGDMTRVRELYALASYEEALAQLDLVEAQVDSGQAAQYRALCLLGLGRVADAEQTIARLVVARPTYTMSDVDVSPRLVSLFEETRLRVLPAAARTRYTEAKAAFDRQQFQTAERAFRDVLTLLGDVSLTRQVEGLHDLSLLSASFLQLAEAEVAKTQPVRVEPSPAAAAELDTIEAEEIDVAIPVYTEDDPLVVAPVELHRRMPIWDPPATMSRRSFRGTLEVVINERGQVSDARLLTSIHPYYDGALLDATTRWRFRPAMKDGSPVRFRTRFEIVLPN